MGSTTTRSLLSWNDCSSLRSHFSLDFEYIVPEIARRVPSLWAGLGSRAADGGLRSRAPASRLFVLVGNIFRWRSGSSEVTSRGSALLALAIIVVV